MRYAGDHMIENYRDKKTRQFAEGKFIKAFSGFDTQAERRLAILDAVTSLDDLQALRSNHLEGLSGDRKGQFSIRINLQWRICFTWPSDASGPCDVEITDYH